MLGWAANGSQSVSKCFKLLEFFGGFSWVFKAIFILFFSFFALLITQTTRGHKAIEWSLDCTNVYKQYTAWDPLTDGLSQGVRYRRDSSTRCVARCADVLITFCRVWLLLLIKLTKATWNFTQKHTQTKHVARRRTKRARGGDGIED